MTKWIELLEVWRASGPLRTFAPASDARLATARDRVRDLPAELDAFYKITNGLAAGSFKILPIEDETDKKRTWDSLQRANDVRTTRFLGRSVQMLESFIVFADIGVGRAAAISRSDGSIWYEDDGELRQTDLSLEAFIETSLREAWGD